MERHGSVVVSTITMSDCYAALRRLKLSGRLTVIGDLHGKLRALEGVLRERDLERGLRDGTQCAIFLGDLVDRGPTVEQGGRTVFTGAEAVLDRVIGLARDFPERVFVIAGNHEVMHLRDIAARGLEPGDVSRWGTQGQLGLTQERLDFLASLPLVLVADHAGQRIAVTHAGVPDREGVPPALLAATDILGALDTHPGVKGIVWSNPSWSSKSSGGSMFNRLHIAAFLKSLDATALIRGHENDPAIRALPDGITYICVHTAQGPERGDVPTDGFVYLTWDPPAGPVLVRSS